MHRPLLRPAASPAPELSSAGSVASQHSTHESPALPPCAQSTPEAAHLGRYTAVALGAVSASSSRQHVRRVV